MRKLKVFLGGTCAESTWRDELIPLLQADIFNPVVEDWNESCQELEGIEKNTKCNIHLYVITNEMIGAFSVAEAVESSMTAGKITIFHVLPEGFNAQQLHSFKAVCKMVSKHGGIAYIDDDLMRTARVINYCFGEQHEPED